MTDEGVELPEIPESDILRGIMSQSKIDPFLEMRWKFANNRIL